MILAVLGACSAAPHIMETPEVIAEKNRHFQLYNAAAAAAAAAPDPVPHQAHYQPTHHVAAVHHVQPAYHHVQPAVHHIQPAAVHHVQGGAYNVVQPRWTGPMAAAVPDGVDGTLTPVQPTAEVAAARNAFLATYNAQVAATMPQGHVVAHHVPAVHHVQPVAYQPVHHVQPAHTYTQKWSGPMAATIPAGLPGAGTNVAPTAEVAQATNQFLRAYQQAHAATLG